MHGCYVNCSKGDFIWWALCASLNFAENLTVRGLSIEIAYVIQTTYLALMHSHPYYLRYRSLITSHNHEWPRMLPCVYVRHTMHGFEFAMHGRGIGHAWAIAIGILVWKCVQLAYWLINTVHFTCCCWFLSYREILRFDHSLPSSESSCQCTYVRMYIPLRSIYYGGDFRSSTEVLFIVKLMSHGLWLL